LARKDQNTGKDGIFHERQLS